jgi:hypothetical protein
MSRLYEDGSTVVSTNDLNRVSSNIKTGLYMGTAKAKLLSELALCWNQGSLSFSGRRINMTKEAREFFDGTMTYTLPSK